MDSITQAALGAAIGHAVLGKQIGHRAWIIGAIGGTIPDLDILISPFLDPVDRISWHRGYSHSLSVGLILSLILSWVSGKTRWLDQISFGKAWLFWILALYTHIWLDGFTAYGTQMFLPFSDARISFDSINIVDPVYTIPLLLGIGFSYWLSRKRKAYVGFPNSLGLLLSSVYLISTLGHKQMVTSEVHAQLQNQGISYQELVTVPVKIANVNWYGVAKTSDSLYLGQYSSLEQNEIEFHGFAMNKKLLDGLDQDMVETLTWFAKGFYVVAKEGDRTRLYNLQCDMQGVRHYGDYKAPTSFYFEVTGQGDTSTLEVGMHEAE